MGFKIWCQVGGGGAPFSKLPIVREFSNIWFQTCHFWFRWSLSVLKNHRFFENFKNIFCRTKLKTFFFIGVTRTCCYLRMCGYFRPRTYTVPSVPRPKQSTNEAEGRVYGWMGYQKCPSMFFKLCGYIEHVYTYIYIPIYIYIYLLI